MHGYKKQKVDWKRKRGNQSNRRWEDGDVREENRRDRKKRSGRDGRNDAEYDEDEEYGGR